MSIVEKNNKVEFEIVETDSKNLTIIEENQEDLVHEPGVITAFKAGLLPDWVGTKERAIIIAQASKELGFQPLAGFRALYIINGQVALTATGMAALLKQKGAVWRCTKDRIKMEDDPENYITEIEFFRKGDVINGKDVVHTIDYRWKEAMAAGLVSKAVWQKFPRAMMYARCLSKAARIVCSDWLLGLYMVDEISNDYGYNDEGLLIK